MKIRTGRILNILRVVSFCCGILGVFSFVASAQQSAPLTIKLTLSDAISMAFESSEDLKLSENQILRKESERSEERSYALPHIMGAVEWKNKFEYPNIVATSGTQDYHLNTGATLTQSLFTFGRISGAVSAAQRAVDSSRYSKESMEQEIIYNTKLAYYNVCLGKRIFEIMQESLENAKQNKKILEDRNSQGRVSKYDNIKISADISSRMPAVNNSRADFVSTLETLKIVIGARAEDNVEIIEGFILDYPSFKREDLALALYHNQPAIKALAENIKEAEDLIRSKKAVIFPEVSAYASWDHKGDGRDYYVGGNNMYGYGEVGLKVNIPVWLGGISREKFKQARLDKEDAQFEYQQGQEKYLLLLDKSINEYREYQKTLKANDEAIHWATESFKYSQELFGAGQVSLTDLNDAELQLTNAKRNKEVTLFNLNIILAQIERLTLIGNKNE